MTPIKFIYKWSGTVAKIKKSAERLKKKKEIKITLNPVYVSHNEFLEKKAEVQKILAKMYISAHKRGRPSMQDGEELDDVA